MQYMCNLWITSEQPVAPVYRTDSISAFKAKLREIFTKLQVQHYRVVVTKKMTIVSAPTDPQSTYKWFHTEFTFMPDSVEYHNFKLDPVIRL